MKRSVWFVQAKSRFLPSYLLHFFSFGRRASEEKSVNRFPCFQSTPHSCSTQHTYTVQSTQADKTLEFRFRTTVLRRTGTILAPSTGPSPRYSAVHTHTRGPRLQTHPAKQDPAPPCQSFVSSQGVYSCQATLVNPGNRRLASLR
jgi:hypothetical protein